MLPGTCPLSNCTPPPFQKKRILIPFFEQFKPLNNSAACARSTEDAAARVREDVQSLHAGLPGISALRGVPSVTRWCQHPEISGRLGQEEVGAALLREGDVWNSYSTIHGPTKGDFLFFFFLSNGALSPEGEPEKCVSGEVGGASRSR